MAPGALIFWSLLVAAWIIAIPVFCWRLYKNNWRWKRSFNGIVFIWLFLSSVLYVQVVPSAPVTPEEKPEVYKRLLENLSNHYIEQSYSHGTALLQLDNLTSRREGYPILQKDDPIRADMEELKINCVLYVYNPEKGGQVYQGLFVAGNGTPTFGDSVIRFYKYQNGEFSTWPQERHPRGLDFYQWRRSYLRGGRMYCTGGYS